MNLILLRTIDWTGQHLVTFFNQDIVDLAMLAPDVIGQQVLRLEGEAAEETFEALHQDGVLVNQIFESLLVILLLMKGESECLVLPASGRCASPPPSCGSGLHNGCTAWTVFWPESMW